MDGHPPYKIYQKEVYYRCGIWHLDLTHKIKTGNIYQRWSATILWMVRNHPKDGFPPYKIYQVVYNRLEIRHLDLTHKIKTRLQLP